MMDCFYSNIKQKLNFNYLQSAIILIRVKLQAHRCRLTTFSGKSQRCIQVFINACSHDAHLYYQNNPASASEMLQISMCYVSTKSTSKPAEKTHTECGAAIICHTTTCIFKRMFVFAKSQFYEYCFYSPNLLISKAP